MCYIVYLVKIEYVSKLNIFGLEKDISNSSMREIVFPYFIKGKKNYLLPA